MIRNLIIIAWLGLRLVSNCIAEQLHIDCRRSQDQTKKRTTKKRHGTDQDETPHGTRSNKEHVDIQQGPVVETRRFTLVKSL